MRNALHPYLLAVYAISFVSGLGFGVSAYINTGDNHYILFPLSCGFAVANVTYVLTYFMIFRPNKFTYKRGVWTGIISGVLGHPSVWISQNWYAHVCYFLTEGCTDMYGEPPLSFLPGFFSAIGASAGSLVLFGWLSVAIGAYLGYKLMQFARKLMNISDEQEVATT